MQVAVGILEAVQVDFVGTECVVPGVDRESSIVAGIGNWIDVGN